MKILQFAFASDPDDDFLPHNYPVQCVPTREHMIITRTEDGMTARGTGAGFMPAVPRPFRSGHFLVDDSSVMVISGCLGACANAGFP